MMIAMPTEKVQILVTKLSTFFENTGSTAGRKLSAAAAVFMVCVCAVIMFSGCAGGNVRPITELSNNGNSAAEYIVNRGDTLGIQVWGEPRLSGDVVVRDDGSFTLPLVNDVPAEGKTLKQLSEEVTTKLVVFVPSASVSISVISTAPVRYYLSGSFNKPGEYRSDKKITLLQAVATGGGFAPFADESSIMLIRKATAGAAIPVGTQSPGATEFRYRLDYNRVIQGKEPNPELKDGDIIAIQ